MKKLLCGLVHTSLLCFAHQAQAAVNGWTAIGPTGGTVNKIAFSQDGMTAFAIAEGGYFRSQDGGVTWQLKKADFPNAPFDLALDPVDPTRIYVVVPNWPSLYVSADGGATLAPAANLPTAVTQARQIAVSADGQTLYIASGAKIYRSVDRAQSWQARGVLSADSVAFAARLIIDPTDANSLYAIAYTSASTQAVMASHDGGATWQSLPLVSDLSTASVAYDLAINSTNPLQLWAARGDGIWTSGDRGLHWSSSTPTPAVVIIEDPVNPAILYAGNAYGQIYRTADSGANWLDVTGNLFVGQVFSVAINPSQNAHLLAGGIAGINGSSSSGSVWASQQAGLVTTSVVAFSADASADRIYIEIPSSGIYYTAGGAAATTAVNNVGLAQQSSFTSDLLITAMLAQPGNLWASQTSGLSHSTDGGQTWLPQVLVPPTPTYQLFSMASSTAAPQTILAASPTDLYRSVDGGSLWVRVTGVPAGSACDHLMMSSADPMRAYAHVSGPTVGGTTPDLGIYMSTDAGMTWSPTSANPATGPSLFLGMDPDNANVLYGSTTTAFLKSSDSGATWSSLTWDRDASLGYPGALAIDPARPQTMYAASGARIARSVDGGSSWQALRDSSALPNWVLPVLIVDPNRPANLLVGTYGAGVQQFTIAPDLTLQASAPPNPAPVGVATTYSFTVKNLGPFDATGVVVTLQTSPAAQNVSATFTGGSCTVSGPAATCSAGTMRTGATATISLTATPPAAGSFSLSGSIHGDQPDSNTHNNATTNAISVAAVADLSVSGSGGGTAKVGTAVTYTVAVKNSGPNAAPAATMSFQFASGMTPGTVTSTNGTCATDKNVVTCDLSNLPAAGNATITLNASAAVAGQQVSTATISSNTADPKSTNDTANLSTTVSAASTPEQSGGGGGGGGISSLDMLVMAFSLLVRLAGLVVRRNGQLRIIDANCVQNVH